MTLHRIWAGRAAPFEGPRETPGHPKAPMDRRAVAAGQDEPMQAAEFLPQPAAVPGAPQRLPAAEFRERYPAQAVARRAQSGRP